MEGDYAMNLFVLLGALNGFLSVALGAFGAHVLEGRIDPGYIDTWQTAVRYEMFHAAGLLVIGLLMEKLRDHKWLKWSGWLMFAGIIIFSGSLYVLCGTGIKVFGAITPIGGVLFLAAWVLLMVAAKNGFRG